MIRLFTLMVLLLAACAPQTIPPTPTRTPAPTPTRTTATAAPTPTATPAGPLTLRVWLPDVLAGLENVDAGDILADQISGFQAANPDVLVSLRLRASEGVGGILAALRATDAVAPSVMPDVTLLRYADFLAAVQAGLVARLDPADFPRFEALYAPSVAAMAMVDGQRYGVPSTIELIHVASSEPLPTDSWRFEDVLAAQMPLLFPAARPSGISDVFLLQYLTAGGEEVSSDSLELDETALRATLRFYERAVDDDLIMPDVLEYDIPERYAAALGEQVPAIVNAHLALEARRRGAALHYGYVPTLDGDATTLLDGWLWVITAEDGARQAAARSFVNWMIAIDRQAAYHAAIDHLPAAYAAQRAVDADYAAFIAPLVENAIIATPAYSGGTLARALQNAYAAVISGQRTANDALGAVLAQFGG